MRRDQLSEAYAAAWDEWASTEEADAWEATVSDGLVTEPELPS
jgi:hypothetical protein